MASTELENENRAESISRTISANLRACADLLRRYWKVILSLTLAWSWISAFCWGGVVSLKGLAPDAQGYQSLFFMAIGASTVAATVSIVISMRHSYDQLPPWVHNLTTLVMVAGSVLVSLADTVLPLRAIYIVGSILIGCGVNLSYWLWAHLLTRFSSREVLLFMSIAMLGSAVYCVLLSSMHLWLSHTLISLTPIAVVGLHVSYEKGLPGFTANPTPGEKLAKADAKTIAMVTLFFVLTAAVGLTFGLMDGMIYSEDGSQGGTGSYAVSAALAGQCLVVLIVVFYNQFMFTLVGLVLVSGGLILVTSLTGISWTFILHFGTVMFYPLLWSFCTEFGRARAHRASYFMTGFLVYELAQFIGVILKDTVLSGFSSSIGSAMGLSCIYLILTVVMVWLLSSSLMRKAPSPAEELPRCTLADAVDALAEECRLTEREADVLCAISREVAIEDMANEMCVSVQTVRTHVKHVYAKLEVHSRQEAMARVVARRDEMSRSLAADLAQANPESTWL